MPSGAYMYMFMGKTKLLSKLSKPELVGLLKHSIKFTCKATAKVITVSYILRYMVYNDIYGCK